MISSTEQRRRVVEGQARLATIRAQERRHQDTGITKARKTVTYAIQNGRGMVKLGVTTNMPARLRDLQIGSADTLTVLGVVAGNQEQALHTRFAHSHVRGEWFRSSPALLALFSL